MERLTRADVERIVRQHLLGTTKHIEGLHQKLVGLRDEFERAIQRIDQQTEVDAERTENNTTQRAEQIRQLWSAIDNTTNDLGYQIDEARKIAEEARDAAGR